jgi:dynein light chain Tctex-type 1
MVRETRLRPSEPAPTGPGESRGGAAARAESKEESKEGKEPGKEEGVAQLEGRDALQAVSFRQLERLAERVVETAVERQLDGRRFNAAQVPRWVDALNGEVAGELGRACPNVKYAVSTVLYERSRGAGLELGSTALLDDDLDSSVSVTWENDTIGCIVTVFGLAL